MYTSGPDAGFSYVQVMLDDDKVHKLSLKKPTIDKKLLEGVKVHEILNFHLCPKKLYDMWWAWCHPDQIHFFH